MSSILDSFSSFFQNKWVVVILAIILASYVIIGTPELTSSASVIVKSRIFNLVVIFLIAYFSTQNTTIAILLSLAFIMSIVVVDQKCQLKLVEEQNIRLTSGGTPMNVNWQRESLGGGVDLATASEDELEVQGFYQDNDSEQYAPA